MQLLVLLSLLATQPNIQTADTTGFYSEVKVYIPYDIQTVSSNYLKLFNRNKVYNGYAIQLYAGNKEKAVKERSAFVTRFPDIPVAITYENLNYVVQFGHFNTRLQANNMLERIHSKFPRAYIVKTSISYLTSK